MSLKARAAGMIYSVKRFRPSPRRINSSELFTEYACHSGAIFVISIRNRFLKTTFNDSFGSIPKLYLATPAGLAHDTFPLNPELTRK